MAGTSGRVFRRKVKGVLQKTWTVQWDDPSRNTGERKQRMKGGFDTKAEAQKYLASVQTQINTGTFIEPSHMKFNEYIDYWMDTFVRHSVQDTTFQSYTYKLNAIKKRLGHLRLKDITPKHLQDYFKETLDKGLASGSVISSMKLLKSCLKQAVESELILKNPMDKVKRPKANASTVQAANPEELRRFLDKAKNSNLYEIFYLAAMTGMRRGELLGLRWRDIDFENDFLSITQTVQRVRRKALVIHDGAKTDSSRRTIALSPDTIRLLRRLKIKHSEKKLLASTSFSDNDLVFSNHKGDPYDPDHISKTFKNIAQKVGLGHLHFHSLRHTHASLLLAQGENPKLVQERLGHKDASITLNVYSHLLPNAQKNAAQKLDEFLKVK